MYLLLFSIFTIISQCYSVYFTDRPAIQRLTNRSIELAECPFWDYRKNVLYFINIPIGDLYCYHFQTNQFYSINLNGRIGPVVPTLSDPNRLIVGVNTTIFEIVWDGQSPNYQQRILTKFNEKSTNTINDGKADHHGRLWFGTKGLETPTYSDVNQGAQYKVTKDLEIYTMIKPVNVSNGLIWNRNNTKFYYIDSPTRKVVQYDYDDANGTLSNKQTTFDFVQNNIAGNPDGMTMDIDGNLWVAAWGGGSILHINPINGELLQRIPLPAKYVTSVMWGGPNFDILFVTTTKAPLSEEERNELPGSGKVYALTNLGTVGFSMYFADF